MKKVLSSTVGITIGVLFIFAIKQGGNFTSFAAAMHWIAAIMSIIMGISYKEEPIRSVYEERMLIPFIIATSVHCYGIFLFLSIGYIVLPVVAAFAEILDMSAYYQVKK